MRRLQLLAALGLTALLALYVTVVASRAVELVRTGEVVGVVLGVAFGVLPLLAVWFVVRELFLAVQVQRMADELAAGGRLP
ncbi:MAG TPA: hypothetical protein VIK12_09525, partial [Pengzhenrongella sp.]